MMGSLIEELRRWEAAARAGADRLRSLWGSIIGSGLDGLAGWDHP